MPIVPLRDLNQNQILAPGDHANPASLEDVRAATRYKWLTENTLVYPTPGVHNDDLANAHIHLHETTNSFLNAAAPPADLAPVINAMQGLTQEMQAIRQEVNVSRQEMQAIGQEVNVSRQEMQAIRQEVNVSRQEANVFRQEMNAFRQEVRERFDRLEDIAISTAVEHAREINHSRQGGILFPLMLVRFPDGRLPAAPRQLLRSLAIINGLQIQRAKSYATAYGLNLPQDATLEQIRNAIAVHVGAM